MAEQSDAKTIAKVFKSSDGSKAVLQIWDKALAEEFRYFAKHGSFSDNSWNKYLEVRLGLNNPTKIEIAEPDANCDNVFDVHFEQ